MKKKLKEFAKDYLPIIPFVLVGLGLLLAAAKLCDLFA